jgi:hypothetical protein
LIFNNETADIYNILYTADNPLPADIINQAFANAAGVVKPNNSTFENNKGTLTFDIQNLPTILTKNAFENVSYLKELVLPENIQVIETKAFYKSGLQKLYAYGVQSIGDSAFADCTNLFNLGFSAALSYCGPDAFKNVGMNYLTYKGTWDR